MANKNLVFSLVALFISLVCAGLLFVGLFSANWDYVVEHTADTLFVLILGTLMPIFFIVGLVLLIRGTIKREPYAWLFILLALFMMLFIVVFGGVLTLAVLQLYKIKLGL